MPLVAATVDEKQLPLQLEDFTSGDESQYTFNLTTPDGQPFADVSEV